LYFVSKILVSNFVPERLKNKLHAGEILALLSNIMIERASQGRLKGLRFGMSKWWSGYVPKIFTWNKVYRLSTLLMERGFVHLTFIFMGILVILRLKLRL